MITILPSDTSFGKKISIEKIKLELFKYLSTVNIDRLQYEYVTDSSVRLISIIGRNEVEKELPMFEHPILVDGLRTGSCVVVDLRKYVKQIKPGDEIRSVAEVTKDGGHLTFSILRGLYTVDFYNKNYGVVTPGMKNATAAFSTFVANILGGIVSLTYAEIIQVEIGAALYYTIIGSDSDDMDYMKEIAAARVSNIKMTGILSKTILDKAYRDIPLDDLYNNFGKSTDLLVGIIKYLLPDDKADLINVDIIYNNVANIWFGPGAAETVVIGLEHVPTWCALLFSAITDNTFKRSRISMIFDKYSKNIKPADYAKTVSQYLKNKQCL